jgi:lipoate-protein ligase A
MPHSCRLLPLTTAEGTWQMAADEVLLEAAMSGTASLRFYAWSAPTVSLGYFQPADTRLVDPLLASLPWVRRATGGEALVHDRELTYALALPAGPPWQTQGQSWLGRFHRIIQSALAELGIGTDLAPAERRMGPFLCFLHATPCDVILQGAKIAGSAQRRRQGALLQHGGILLGRSQSVPALPGIAELAGKVLNARELARQVVGEFERETGWSLEETPWSEAELLRIGELTRSRYQSAEWNEKR